MVLVPPGDPEMLAGAIEELFAEPRRLAALGALARATVERAFSWQCVRAGDGRRLRGRAALTDRPVLFVTNLVAPDRVGAFRALHARSGIELALFGGRSHHATGAVARPRGPVASGRAGRRPAARRIRADYRAVVCGTAGRLALPAAWAGARRAGVPFVLWSALWAHPRSAAHVAGAAPAAHAVPRRRCRRRLRAPRRRPSRGATAPGGSRSRRRPSTARSGPRTRTGPRGAAGRTFAVVFVGRDEPGKGLDVLLDAWARVRTRAARRRPSRSSASTGCPEGSARNHPPPSATSCPRRTLSSYRRDGPAPSASPGGSSSTRPCTQAHP